MELLRQIDILCEGRGLNTSPVYFTGEEAEVAERDEAGEGGRAGRNFPNGTTQMTDEGRGKRIRDSSLRRLRSE